MQVAEGIHRLTQGVVNFYLVEDQGKLVLVDAGTPADWPLLAPAVAQLGRRVEDVDAILLTHAHGDHTGFAERLRVTAGATVSIHSADQEMARGGPHPKHDGKLSSHLLHGELYRTMLSLMRRGGRRIVPIAELSAFADGETLDVPGRPRVVHAPGHTEGSCVLLFEGRRALLTGDVLVTHNPLTGRRGPQIMPSALNQDTDRALASLRSIEGTAATTVLPGHGGPWTDGVAEAVRRARSAGAS